MNFSLIHGSFLWIVITAAIVLMVAAVRPWSRHRLLLAVGVGVVSLGLTFVFNWQSNVQGWIQPALPASSIPWVWAVFFALGWLVVGWRAGGWRTRVFAPLAVMASLTMALALFNAYFGYYPTSDALVGTATRFPASPSQVAQIDQSVRLRRDRPQAVARVMSPEPQHGLTLPMNYSATESGFSARGAWVYLPPAWFGPRRADLPVVLLLSGTPSFPDDWMRSGYADRFADAFAAENHGMAPIVATVDENGSLMGDSECVERPGSKVETYVIADVKHALETHLGVTSNPQKWAIAGLSEGGLCAENIALRHPGEFGVFGDFGGNASPELATPEATMADLFHGDRVMALGYNPRWLLRQHQYPNLSAMYVVGSVDGGHVTLAAEARHAQRAGLQVQFVEPSGAHTFDVWRSAFQDFLPFMWQHTMVAPSQAQAPALDDLTRRAQRTVALVDRGGLRRVPRRDCAIRPGADVCRDGQQMASASRWHR